MKNHRKKLLILTLGTVLQFWCYWVNATEYNVYSADDIAALSTLQPGDVVVMADKVWSDQNIVFEGIGTENNPITLRPRTLGQAVLTGTSTLDIAGEYLKVEGLKFIGGNASGSVIEFRHGSRLAHHCRLTNVTIKDYNPADKNVDSKWVSLYGTFNRVDHCSFSGKVNMGTTLVVWMDEIPDNHLIDHNYFGPRPELGANGGETIRIGTSTWVEYSSNTIVEYNLFEECDGEVEIISNKSVGNHYRFNTFRNCNGSLTLRHGSYCKVYGNFFFGGVNKNSGGVRIIGEGHEVYNNYMQDLNGTSYRAAICLVNGMPDSPVSGYYQVRKVKIGFNSIINCKQSFAIGAGKDASKTLPPEDSYIVNNLIKARTGYSVVEDYDITTGVIWDGNIYEGDELGISPVSGMMNAEIEIDDSGEFYRPVANGVAAGAGTTSMEQVETDIEGQSRPQNGRDVGCDQNSDGIIVNKPLVKEDVGADYSVTTSMEKAKVKDIKVFSHFDGITIEFPSNGTRDVSIWTIDGRKILQTSNEGTYCVFKNTKSYGVKIVTIEEESRSYSLKVML